MGYDFSITTEIAKGQPYIAVLNVHGWLDAQSEGQLVEAVQQARAKGAECVVIDLAGVSTITSAGIRALQASYGIMMPRGETVLGRLKLCCAVPTVYEVLSITGILISMPMYEGADIAIDSFGK